MTTRSPVPHSIFRIGRRSLIAGAAEICGAIKIAVRRLDQCARYAAIRTHLSGGIAREHMKLFHRRRGLRWHAEQVEHAQPQEKAVNGATNAWVSYEFHSSLLIPSDLRRHPGGVAATAHPNFYDFRSVELSLECNLFVKREAAPER